LDPIFLYNSKESEAKPANDADAILANIEKAGKEKAERRRKREKPAEEVPFPTDNFQPSERKGRRREKNRNQEAIKVLDQNASLVVPINK
jgi:hypothetical protein